MRAVFLTFFLLMGCGLGETAAVAQDPVAARPLSREAEALIAPVLDAIEGERARQAALPPPANDRERLERLGRLDQAPRQVLGQIDLSSLPAAEREAAGSAMWGAIWVMDTANMAALLEMVPPEGWFLKSVYGEEAARAAFLIVQHSGLEHWRRFVPLLEPLVATGEVDGGQYALMYDRLQTSQGLPQRYGSQMTCRDSRWVLFELEDQDRVDEWRTEMGLGPLADYVARFADQPPCD